MGRGSRAGASTSLRVDPVDGLRHAPRVAASGHFSIARVRRAWYVAATASALGARPLASTILDVPLVLFRDGEGVARALLDRCAHRNVPLSRGAVDGGRLTCGYHGWGFDGDGVCRVVPALVGEALGKARRVPSYPTREAQGLVFVWMDPDVEPTEAPYVVRGLGEPGYDDVRFDARLDASLHMTAENVLDVPHTAFLHRGLFRGKGEPNRVRVELTRSARSVEARYVGEPRPSGWIGQLLAPGGGEIEHVDRFHLPCVTEVEYRLGAENHLVVTSLLTPISDWVTHMYAITAFKLRVPHAAVKPIALRLGRRVVEQDIEMLRAQVESVRRFDGERYVSTDVDVLGPHIWHLLKLAERGEQAEPHVASTELLA